MWFQAQIAALALQAFSSVGAAAAPEWRMPDLENTLAIDTSKGRVLVELRPEFAPNAVARIKRLAREHVYDGLLFHRVIAGFVAQTGNPNNRDGGGTSYPDLKAEFTFRLPPASYATVSQAGDATYGFVGATPVQGQAKPSTDGRLRAWGAYCTGVMGMGRQEGPDTANSEIFFMLAPVRRLDHDYTAVGRVIGGMAAIQALAVGEPPAHPDRMLRVRVLADIPEAERPRIQVLDERSPAFRRLVDKTRRAKGADFSICDVDVPAAER